MQKYRERQKKVAATVEQDNKLLKVKDELTAEALVADKDKFYNNPDTVKGDRYQAWLKGLKSDRYINESVKVVDQLVHAAQQQTVLN